MTEIYERIPLERLLLLKKMTIDNYCLLADKKKYKLGEIKVHYKQIMDYVKDHIKCKGEMKKVYKHTESCQNGRLYGESSIQNLDGIIRGFLFGSTTTDFDMKNAHPHILEYICRIRKIHCPNLSEYVKNRDKIVVKLKTIGVIDPKFEILKMLNTEKTHRINNDCDNILKGLRDEFKIIRGKFKEEKDFVCQLQEAMIFKPNNVEGSFVNRILCIYENQIMNTMASFVHSKNYEIAQYAFDGILVYGDFYDDNEFLQEMTDFVNEAHTDLNMVLTMKQHSKTISYEFLDNLEENNEPTEEEKYAYIKDNFEKSHAKIINNGLFITEANNGFSLINKSTIVNGWEHLSIKNKDDYDTPFIHCWLKDPTMRTYDNIKCIPPPLICPSNTYNTWKPFAMESKTDWEEKDITPFLNHIKIICNNEDLVFDYVVKWLAQMIQYPSVKTIMIVFQSVEEGTGKGMFLQIIQKLIGSTKYLETTSPSRDIWGAFNGRMAESYLVHLSELSKKDTIEAEGKIKGLITDEALQINSKGKDQYEINSYHRFILCTNHEEGAIKTHVGDRRKLIIKTSRELVGNRDYFDTILDMIRDDNYIKSFYEYLKAIPNMDEFHKIKVPMTQYQLNLCELSVSPVEQFIKDFITTTTEKTIKILAKELFREFNRYIVENKINYETNSTMFGTKISNLSLDGITKKRTSTGYMYTMDTDGLKTHYKLGCLINI